MHRCFELSSSPGPFPLPHFMQSNKELSSLHRQIMQIQADYKSLQSQYNTKIKYRLKEAINVVHSVNGCQNYQIADEGSYCSVARRQALRNACEKGDSMHVGLDSQFDQLFSKNYLGTSLQNLASNGTFIAKTIDDMNTDIHPHESTRNTSKLNSTNEHQQRPHQLPQKQKNNSSLVRLGQQAETVKLNQIIFQLEKQKHANITLYKEIQMLEKEYSSLEAYCQSTQSAQSQQLETQKLSEQDQSYHQSQEETEYEQSSACDNDSALLSTSPNDEELSSQLQCLQKLIQSKSSIIKSLQSSNHSLRLRTDQLKAKQLYLTKKKTLLENNQLHKHSLKLQKHLDRMKANVKDREEIQGRNDLSNQIPDFSRLLDVMSNQINHQKYIKEACKQILQTGELIKDSLGDQVFQQKIHTMQNQFKPQK